MKRISLITCLTSLVTFTNVEYNTPTAHDSLTHMDYQKLEMHLLNLKDRDTIASLHIAKHWLKKAHIEKNLLEQSKALKAMMHLEDKRYRMIYADSLIDVALKMNDDEILGSAYLTVGSAYYDNKEYSKALNSYITANSYIAKTNNQYLANKVNYTIALTKYFLGYYHESIALLTTCMDYFREENDLGYLKSMHSISLCYAEIERYDLATFYNNLGIELAHEYELEDMIMYFKNAEGINQCKQKKYVDALQLLNSSLQRLEQAKDFANIVNTWLYLGKCYWQINQKEAAISFFFKIDEAIQLKKFNRPDLRESYELIIEYFESEQELNNQLLFINKLIAFDKKVNKEFKFLSYKIYKEYDTNALMEKKKKIENELLFQKKVFLFVIILFGLIIMVLYSWHVRSKKREKKKFDQIMEQLKENKNIPIVPLSTSNSLSAELAKSLLLNLEKFEKNKKYLDKDINLSKLAEYLSTNTKYVSLLISQHRGKKTITYINDLKIDYIVDLLINNNKFRNYTNKALAEEAGFGSTQIFTLSFKNKIGISPTSFINQLKLKKENEL